MNDSFGDRMKYYEKQTDIRFLPLIPVMARVGGRCFSRFTRDMARPYDVRMHFCMLNTALKLAEETNACMTYTQSDEITLAWLSTSYESQIWFDGRHSKMVSQLGSLATLFFYREVGHKFPEEYLNRLPTFDARVWQVPSTVEGANVFLWREWDATKNSISMAAQAYYSTKQLHGKNSSEKQEMLFQKGVNWNDYPDWFKRGVYIQRRTVLKPFTADEIEKLPARHNARLNPALKVERSEFRPLDMPRFASVLNREEVVFNGEEPLLSS